MMMSMFVGGIGALLSGQALKEFFVSIAALAIIATVK
jgi:hypothetical protein